MTKRIQALFGNENQIRGGKIGSRPRARAREFDVAHGRHPRPGN